MQIQTIPLTKIIPYARNPRQNSGAPVAKVKASLKEFGWRQPIVVDRDMVIVVGHTRYAAALELGMTDAPVHIADTLTPAQIKAYRIADNRTGAEAQWDMELLGLEIQDLKELDFSLDLTGFDADELAGIELEGEPETEGDTEPQADRADELRKKWDVKPGDLWALGEHRLLCGDSTKAEDVARVMGGENADLCFTSPPYGQQRDYRDGATEKVSDWDSLMQGVFANLPMSDDGQVLVNLGLIHRNNEWVPYWDVWIKWMRQHGWRRFGWYVWDQGGGLMGNWSGRFAPSFEFVFHFNKQSKEPCKFIDCKENSIEKAKMKIKAHNQGKRVSGQRDKNGDVKELSSINKVGQKKIPDSVLRIYREQARGLHTETHPAVFPVQFPEFAMQAWPGMVYEPFSGSGTTLIACENLKRRCRAIELSPGYVAVALQRWADHTGKTPTLIS